MYLVLTHSHHSALPASVLDEDEEDDDEEIVGESRDDERSGTRYNVRVLMKSFRNHVTDPHKVLLVPHHLRPRCDVRRDAANRLVSTPTGSAAFF